MNRPKIKFSKSNQGSFYKILNTRVNQYFKDRNIKKTGNWKLYIKSMVMFGLLFFPPALALTVAMPEWVYLILVFVTGVGLAGVGMNVMHDGNHGSFSSKKWVNKIMGGSMYILGGNVYNWQVQHNVLHHTFTNIQGFDEDLEAGRIVRFSKHSKWWHLHRFQKYYAIFLYGLLTINWAITTDVKQMCRYLKKKLSYGKTPNPTKEWSVLILTKVLYYTLWLALPLLVLDLAWWKVLAGFFLMHFTAGLILSLVFQLAHVVPKTEVVLPEKDGNMDNSWAIHQLYSTANFAPNNKLVSWYTGGLNHQIEHHIFPKISHIHYSKIAEILKKTAKEFNLPYHEYKSTRQALAEHFKQISTLGLEPVHI